MAAKKKGPAKGKKGAKKAVRRKRKAKKKAKEKAAAPPDPPGESKGLLDMDQAIARLKTTRPTFYRWLRSGKVKGMKVGRQWRFYRHEIDRFLKGEEPKIELTADIRPLLKTLEERLTSLDALDKQPADATDTRKAVNHMLRLGIVMGASDIHVAPHFTQDEAAGPRGVVRLRVDGVLHSMAEFDVRLLPAVIEEWKVQAACDRHEKQKPQDARILVPSDGDDRPVDVRVGFITSALGETVTARILDPGAGARYLSLDNIRFPETVRDAYRKWLNAPHGVIIVTGPTGCGKTSTIYAGLKTISRPEIKIMTIEDPVEYHLPWMVQTQVRPQYGIGFIQSIRAIMRADPDVVLVGEVRDLETLQATQTVALTGHLVLTALHASDGAKALARIVEVGGDANMVAESVKLVVAQRLFRTLCPKCCQKEKPSASRLAEAADLARTGGMSLEGLPEQFHKAVGCPECRQTGFHGRSVIAEALEVTPEIAAGLRRGASADEIRAIAVGQGMTTLASDGIRRAAEGVTTLGEIFRILGLR
ncbi:MAG: ATPase, T2SS/T4P/T4SS family [Planctomycetota bacterium]|jgi:excisionase family DNA binding protein